MEALHPQYFESLLVFVVTKETLLATFAIYASVFHTSASSCCAQLSWALFIEIFFFVSRLSNRAKLKV